MPTPTPPPPDPRDALVLELSGHLLPFMRALQHAATRVFAPLDLRPSQVLVLELIRRGVDRPKSLADVLETVPSAVTALVADLEAKGLVERTIDPDDRRRIQLQLTLDGQERYAQLGRAWLEAGRRHLDGIDVEDLHAVVRIVGVVAERGKA